MEWEDSALQNGLVKRVQPLSCYPQPALLLEGVSEPRVRELQSTGN